MASSSLVLCSIIPRYWIILVSVTPCAAPNISSIADRSQLILPNNESMPGIWNKMKIKSYVIDITVFFHGLLDEIMFTEISMVEARSYRKAILTSIISKFNTCTVYCLKTVQFWWSVGQKRNKHNFTNGQTPEYIKISINVLTKCFIKDFRCSDKCRKKC